MIGDMKGHVKGRKDQERGTKGNWKPSGRVNADSRLPSGKG
jgi:hypothetical protein